MAETSEKEFHLAAMQNAREVGLFVVRTLVTLNGGSIVVLLTFIGNSGKSSAFSLDPFAVKWAMILFVAGLTLAFGTAVIAYIYSARTRSDGLDWAFSKSYLFWVLPFAITSFGLFATGVMHLSANIHVN